MSTPKQMKKLLLILIFARLTAFGQDDMNAGIIYGKDLAFGLKAPKGWVLDNQSGVSQGLHAVFYEQGQSWENATTVIYANTASLIAESHKTLTQLIKYDLDNFTKNYSGLEITDGKDILIKGDLVAKVKYLSGQSYGNYEAISYIDAGKTGVMIILSSRTKDGFEKSLAAFESLVKSYVFVSDEVVIDKK
jgi:hypothetical protein